jgi:hypothetical protein
MSLPEGAHLDLLREAIAVEARGQRALLAGEPADEDLRAAAELYRRSWEVAPPASYGRLIGMLKAAVLAGDAGAAARCAREAIPDDATSPTARYAVAIAALIEGDDAAAARAAEAMRAGASAVRADPERAEAFLHAAEAIAGLAARDRAAYANAVRAIVADFESRTEHLTGVPIADTALMFERLAAPRGLAVQLRSPLLPPV